MATCDFCPGAARSGYRVGKIMRGERDLQSLKRAILPTRSRRSRNQAGCLQATKILGRAGKFLDDPPIHIRP
jgi:hypothetical protein